ncbi:MAG: cation:proton antiporter [Acidobacteria bacterium]|nr:cation:proton antiporter [Acidobacteriota bacterium]
MKDASVLTTLLLVFAAAKLAGEILERLRLPAVLGELGVGVLLGPSVLDWIRPGEILGFLAEIGVIVLLFRVGLETNPAEMRATGGPALAVALIGVALPFALGFGAALGTGHGAVESAFVATALVATSVAVTSRTFADLGALATDPARIVLGAAVIDDVLGLLVLAVVAGLSNSTLSAPGVAILAAEALGFVVALALLGPRVMARISHLLEAPRTPRAPFAVSVVVLLGLSAAAESIGLAAIVGAFLAGTLLAGTREQYQLERQVQPLADLLGPFFFVVTGAQLRVGSLADPRVLGLAALVTALAVAGKVIAGLAGARRLGRRGSLLVGVGMVPRGEVGIVVAGLALEQGVVTRDVFGAVIAMIAATTLVAPPVLGAMLARDRARG